MIVSTQAQEKFRNTLDFDGKIDIAVWRETEGNYYVARSLDNTTPVASR